MMIENNINYYIKMTIDKPNFINDIIDKSIKLLEQSSQNSRKFDFGNFKENAVS